MIRSRHQPSNEEVPNGPARDPDRDTGSAARPRSRRASARWVQATTPDSPSLPLIAIGRSAVAHIEYRPTSSGSPPPGPMAPPRSGADLPPAPLRRVRPEPSRSAPAKRLAARYVKGHSENGRKTDASAIRPDLRFDKRSRIPGSPWNGVSSVMDIRQLDRHPATDRPARRACLVAGCPCKDARIVSHRRAAFFASWAASHGETADRVVAPDPTWRIDPATGTLGSAPPA
jgi:hypothetical protein